ncbi:endo-1,4-beta-xylanase [Laspinema olomoucense]|uniref:endo-1,4-beta-xylanase n=1 Tax=Laspinema olomoucense TaxID=3231600 RepID=UPI0021BAEBAF|nr:endo-1,4-beta-xylanase [Laspinema sp. D3a]MCT7988829.1 endo-1,4-beta-xylanase [Laspinema sp. D3a]
MGLKNCIPKGFYLGCAEEVTHLKTDELLQELIVKNFNFITPQNALKLGRIGKNPHDWNFEESDWVINFAHTHNLSVRGHLMTWARSIPEWMREMESYQFSQLIKEYIFETMRRYPTIKNWDVCGEAFDDKGNIRDTILSALIGPHWVRQTLIWAREARPDARLFYSEYRLQGYRKQKALLKLINELLIEGNILDGIGVQLHHNTLGVLRLFGFKDFLKTLTTKGLTIHFSEVTVWDKTTLSENFGRLSQAVAYSELFRLCRDCGSEVFNIWGSTDRYSWRHPELTPFLFNREYQPKPAYFALYNALTRSERIVS